MKFSIIVTTYNGMQFITEQLDSLRNQTRTPDAVYIFDDKSNDGTQEFIQSYIMRYGLNWEFKENQTNLGWKQNYLNNIPHTSGEIVFLCDQDDIWHPEKCELMMHVMETKTDCNVLLSNYYPFVMPGGPPVSRSSRHHSDNRSIKKVAPTMSTMQATLRPGCTSCIRRTFFNEVIPFWNGELSHDGFLFYMGLLTGSVYLYNFRSIHFRRHGNNNSPLIKISVDGLCNNIKQIENLMDFQLCYMRTHAVPQITRKNSIIKRIRSGCQVRRAFLLDPTMLKALRLLIIHHALYLTPTAIVRDFKISGLWRKRKV